MTTEQRREMILQSALPLVAEYGSAVTTAQIARAAGIGEATVFRVYADKDELLQACIARALDPSNLLRQLHSIDLDLPVDERLVEAADALSAHLGRMGAVLGALHATGHHRRRPPSSDDTTESDPDHAGGPAGKPASGRDDTASRGPGSARNGTAGGRPGSARNGTAGGRPGSGLGGEPAGGPGGGPGRLRGRFGSQAETRDAVAELLQPDADRLRLPVRVATDVFLGFMFSRGRFLDPEAEPVEAADLVDLFLHGALKPTPADLTTDGLTTRG
jgi:AcrR family transcriptional regulator